MRAIVLILVLLQASVSHAQLAYEFPFGDGDYYFTSQDIHELYWQVAPHGQNVITNIDFMEVKSNTSEEGMCTFYFLVDRTQNRLVCLHSEGIDVEPRSFGTYLGPSYIGRISDLLVTSSFGNDRSAIHDIYLCDESNARIMHMRQVIGEHSSKDDDSMTLISADKWPMVGEKPRKIEYIGGGKFAIIDAWTNSIMIVDSDGIVSTIPNVIDSEGEVIQLRNLAVWLGHDGLWYVAVTGYTKDDKVVIYRSYSQDFNNLELVSEEAFSSPVVSIEYESHIGLVVLHANGFTDIYDNGGIWTLGINTAWNFRGEGTVNCLALVRDRIYFVPTFGAGSAWAQGVSCARYTEGTSVSWPTEELFVGLNPVSFSYKINYPGAYRLDLITYSSGGMSVSQVPGMDFSVGTHSPEFWMPQLEASYIAKFRLMNWDDIDGNISYFESDDQWVYWGPRVVNIEPVENSFLPQSIPFLVTFSVDYDDVVLPNIRVVMEDGNGDVATSIELSDLSSGQHSCSLAAPFVGTTCETGEYFYLRVYADFEGGTRASEPTRLVVRTKDCEDLDTPVDGSLPGPKFAGKTLVGDDSVFSEFFKILSADKGLPSQVSVYNIRGQRKFHGDPASLDARGFSAGLYFVKTVKNEPAQRIMLLK